MSPIRVPLHHSCSHPKNVTQRVRPSLLPQAHPQTSQGFVIRAKPQDDLCCCTRISRGQGLCSLFTTVSHLERNHPVGLTMRKVSGEQEELCCWLCSITGKLGLLSSWWAGTVI